MLQKMEMSGPVLAEVDLAAAERRLGVSLPAPYRRFLLRYNGGRPEPHHYRVPGWNKGHGILNDFDGIVPGAYNDLEQHAELLRPELPRGFLPIADDPGGNALLLGLEGTSRGRLYFWDHERQPAVRGPNLEDYPNIFPVADDFDAFLEQLHELRAGGS